MTYSTQTESFFATQAGAPAASRFDPGAVRFPFGRNAGIPLRELNSDFLSYIVQANDGIRGQGLLRDIKAELARRGHLQLFSKDDLNAVLSSWRAQLGKRHKRQGIVLAAIDQAADLLTELLNDLNLERGISDDR